MSQFEKELRVYADNGLRTAADWLTLGRQVVSGSKPKVNATMRGQLVDLFNRQQTELRARAQRD